MSTEETEDTYNITKRLPDDNVSFITLENGGRAILLKIADEADVKERCFWLERTKQSSATDESRQFNYMPPSTYNIAPDGATIKIMGDLDDLEDAAYVLHQCHNYISPQKLKQLTGEICDLRCEAQHQIWKKERQERKTKQARKETAIREKYAPLVEKFGLDKDTAFASLSRTKKKSSTTTPKNIRPK